MVVDGIAQGEVSPTTYCYKQVKGVAIELDVYKAPKSVGKPVILWIHGGALIFGNRRQLPNDQARFYLSHGYTVISIDYRLAPESKLPEIVEDILSAYEWLQENGSRLFDVAPDRTAVVGHSAGGYLALLAGVRFEPKPKALVSFYGYGDITSDWYYRADPHYLKAGVIETGEAYSLVGDRILTGSEVFPRNTFYKYCRQNGLWPQTVCGFDPRSEPEGVEPFCPIRHVSETYPPTLLIHGDKDTDVPYLESVRMAKQLEKHNVPHSLLLLEGSDHLFDIYPERLPTQGKEAGLTYPLVARVFAEVGRFLSKHLDGSL